MAARFDDANDETLISSTPMLTDWVSTWFAWVWRDDTTASGIITMGDDADDNVLVRLYSDGSQNLACQIRGSGATLNSNVTSGTIPAGAWASVALAMGTDGEADLWLNGSPTTSTDTNSPTFQTFTNFAIGSLDRIGAPILYWDGAIAEVAIWDVELNTAEMASLHAGYSPKFIRPASLLEHYPLIRSFAPTINPANDFNTEATATVDTVHPRIINPVPPLVTTPVAAVGGGFVPYPNPRYALTGGMQNMAGGV